MRDLRPQTMGEFMAFTRSERAPASTAPSGGSGYTSAGYTIAERGTVQRPTPDRMGDDHGVAR